MGAACRFQDTPAHFAFPSHVCHDLLGRFGWRKGFVRMKGIHPALAAEIVQESFHIRRGWESAVGNVGVDNGDKIHKRPDALNGRLQELKPAESKESCSKPHGLLVLLKDGV